MDINIIKFEDTNGEYLKVTGEGKAYLDGEEIELPPVLIKVCKRIAEAQKEFGEVAVIKGHKISELVMWPLVLDTNAIIDNNGEENAHKSATK